MNKLRMSNSERKTAKKYFLRNETHEYLQSLAGKREYTPSKILQEIIDNIRKD